MPKNLTLWACTVLAGGSVLAGGGGMCLSLLHMSCAETNDIIAGGAGFIAGAVLVGAGIIALAVVSLATVLTARDSDPSAPASESNGPVTPSPAPDRQPNTRERVARRPGNG